MIRAIVVTLCLLSDPLNPSTSGGIFEASRVKIQSAVPANDTAPDVSAAEVFITSANAAPTALTDLTLPSPYAMIWIVGGSNVNSTTISDAGNFNLDPRYGVFTASVGAWISLYVLADNSYMEVGRGDDNAVRAMSIGALTATSGDFSDGNIVNVGDVALDSLSQDGTGITADVTTNTFATCNGTCPAWGHSPTLACEGAAEIDGVAYLDGGFTSGSNGNMGAFDLLFTPTTGAQCTYDEIGATCGTRTDDANSINRTINSSDVSPFAAVAKVPGALILRGGLDSKTVGCTQATCDNTDTVVVTRIINGVSAANTLTYGTDFCAGTTCTDPATATLKNEAMSTSLAAAIEGLSGIGSTASGAECSGGVANSRCVGVTADRLTSKITITDSNAHAACTVISLGTDGAEISFGTHWFTAQTLAVTNPDICIGTVANCASGNAVGWYGSGGTMYFGSGSTNTLNIDATSLNLSANKYVSTLNVRGTPQTITCAAGAGASTCGGGAQTLNASVVLINCEDADGCTLTLTETNYSATVVTEATLILGTATGTLTLADSAGVVELAGGVSWTPSTSGNSLTIVYSPALYWVEKARAAL
jgi:hypothetical protein